MGAPTLAGPLPRQKASAEDAVQGLGKATATRTSKKRSKTATLHVRHTFFVLHDYDVKMPNFAFHGGRKQASRSLFLNSPSV